MAVAINKRTPAIRWHTDGRVIINTSDQKLRDFIKACMFDERGPEIFIRGFFPKAFNGPWNEQRRDYVRRINDFSIPKGGYLARRTFGKTSLLIGSILHSLCFRRKRFVLFTTNDQTISEERTDSLRTMLMTTPEIRDIFGYLRPQSVEGMKESFGTKSWRLVDPITGHPFAAVVPKSSNATVNGLVLYVSGNMERPDLLLSDDGEDRRTLNNEELRKNYRHWMTDVFMQCADTNQQPDVGTQRWLLPHPMSYAPWNVRVIDTNKHDDAFLPRLFEAPKTTSGGEANFWDTAMYPVAEAKPGPTFSSLVPDIMTTRQVNALYRSFEAEGNPEGFWREFMCVRRPGHGHVFPATFQYYKDSETDFNTNELIDKFIICDPALTEDSKAAYSSMLAVAIDRVTANIYLRRQITERMAPEEFDDNLFKLAATTNTYWILIEGLKSNNRFRDAMVQAALVRGYSCGFESLSTHTGSQMVEGDFGTGRTAAKRKRGVFAVRLYRPYEPTHPNGHVWHDESLRDSPLEMQERSYPNCTFWDALDCLGHIPQAMQKLGIFFDHQLDTGEWRDGTEHDGGTTQVSLFGELIDQGAWRVC